MDNLEYMNLLYSGEDGLSFGYDTTGDNEVDTFLMLNNPTGESGFFTCVDTTGDGAYDTIQGLLDCDGDGLGETLFVANDYDADGKLDYAKYYLDTTGDGESNMVASIHADNTSQEQGYRVEMDFDFTGDHQSDYHYEEFVPSEDGSMLDFSMFPSSIGTADSNGCFDPNTPVENVSGTPAKDMEVWECQGQTNRCSLFSQLFTIEQLTGSEIDIEEFADIAEEKGWFTEDGGTNMLNMDKMLTYYNINHDVVFDANIEQLEAELNNGSKLIVSVDSGQIWYGEANDIFSPSTRADHAVQVIGIDHSDPDNPMVVLNDSGTPMGCGEMVPLDVFENAWSAGDHQLIISRA